MLKIPVCNWQVGSYLLFANWRDLDLYLTKYFQMMILAI